LYRPKYGFDEVPLHGSDSLSIAEDQPVARRLPDSARDRSTSQKTATVCQFSVSDKIWLAAIERDFAGLLFPNPARRAAAERIQEPLLGVAALHRGRPVGVALADIRGGGAPGRVLSWCVTPGFWGRGIGTELLSRLEQAARERGTSHLELFFRSDWRCAAVIRQILKQSGWTPPAEIVRLIKIEQKDFTTPDWFCRVRLPRGYVVFPWSELSETQRSCIIRRQVETQWYPTILSPFQLPEQIDSSCSLGLSYHGEVVGWLIAHRIRPELVQYTSLFVSPELQSLGRAIPLAVEALKQQFAAGIPKAMFQVLPDNTPFLKFIQRRLDSYLTSQVRRYGSYKELFSTRT